MKLKNLLKLSYSSERIYGLDILRAIAISTVVLGHFRHAIEDFIDVDLYLFFILDGVSIFFVLSGFLIGGILIKLIDKKPFTAAELFNFWTRRWFRTLPTYFLVLFILLVLNLLVHNKLPFKWHYYTFFSQNIFFVIPTSFFPEAWSLSVEEWFYLSIPLLLFFTLRCFKNVRRVFIIWIFIVIIVILVYRTSKAAVLQCSDIMCWVLNIRQLVVTRIDSMMFGVLAAYVNFYHNKLFFRNKNIYFICGLILLWTPQVINYLYPHNFLMRNFFLLPLYSIGTMLVLPKFCSIRSGDGFVFRLITTISLTSYSMYLFHWSIIYEYGWYFLQKTFSILEQSSVFISFIKYFFALTSTYLLSIIVYKYFEVPILKLRDKNDR